MYPFGLIFFADCIIEKTLFSILPYIRNVHGTNFGRLSDAKAGLGLCWAPMSLRWLCNEAPRMS